MNTNKYQALANGFKAPRSTSDLDIYFMECMEQIEFAGNNSADRELFSNLFRQAATQWFPNQHQVDVFDRYYEQTAEMVG